MVERCLERIERLEDRLRAFVTVTADRARAGAGGLEHAPLRGLVVAVKDNVDVAGVRATCGSRLFADRVPEEDAPAWARLAAAGAVLVGKANLHELAFGATTQNPHFGSCRNPWALDRIPGGSSGGSAVAVAAGLCDAALGTDTGGSVRIPAALVGVTGLRPTLGAVPNRGVLPVAASFDTVGPLARSVEDVARVFRAIAGFDAADPTSVDGEHVPGAPVERLRVGVAGGYFRDGVETGVARAVDEAALVMEAAGAQLVEVELPGAADALAAALVVAQAEALALHRERLDESPGELGEDVRRRLELGRSLTGVDVALALSALRAWRREVERAFERVDVVLSPTTPIVAPPAEGDEALATTRLLTSLTWPWSAAGCPALSFPCGFVDGLPAGLQLAAAPWREETLLAAGAAYQRATDWHLREPPLEP